MFRLWKEERRGDETKEEQPWLLQWSTNTAPIKLWISVLGHELLCASQDVCDRLGATQAPRHAQHQEPARNVHTEQIKEQGLSYKGDNPIHLLLLLWDACFGVSIAPAPPAGPILAHPIPAGVIPQPQPSCLPCHPCRDTLGVTTALTFIHPGDSHGEAAEPSWWVLKSTLYTASS